MEFLAGLGLIFFVLIVVGTIIWAFQDAEERGKPGCLVALMVLLLTWPVGLIVWLVVRPERMR